MDAVESNMVLTNEHIGTLDNSVNYMTHMLAKFMKETKQNLGNAQGENGSNLSLATASVSTNADGRDTNQTKNSATVVDDIILDNQSK